MSGGKGSKPAGNVTMTNLTGQKQEPFLTEGWDAGKALFNQNFGNPNAIVGNAGENMLFAGLDNLYNSAGNIQNQLQPQANAAWQTGATRDIYSSPAYQAYQSMANRATPEQGWLQEIGANARNAGDYYSRAIGAYAPQLAAMAQQAGSNNNLGLSTLGQIAQGQGTGMQQLGQAASGSYLGGNPYFASMVQSALDPIAKNYQTAISPQIDTGFETAGRYGSGAMLGQRAGAAEILAGQLAKASTGMYGENYARERQAQDAAAQQYAGLQNQAGNAYGQLYNQGIQTGLTGLGAAANTQQNAANTLQQGVTTDMNTLNSRLQAQQAGAAGLQGGYQAGNNAALQAAQMYPQLAQANLLPAQTEMAAGQGYNTWEQQYLDAPYTALQRYMGTIGQPIGAGTSQPYFQNNAANTMAGITGGLDIMSKMGGMLGKI